MQLFVLRTVYEAKTNPLVPIATFPVSNLGITLLALPIIVTKIKFQVSVAMTTTSKPCTHLQIRGGWPSHTSRVIIDFLSCDKWTVIKSYCR